MRHSFFFGKLVLVLLFCLNELSQAVSTSHLSKRTKFVDNIIGLVEVSDVESGSEFQKRNSIVEGGVFVPYKSTTIVYKSRLVPVTYGFVINKETLKNNPALNKLGVKLLDKVESSGKKHLKPNSNGDKGSKLLLKFLNNLSRDISKIKKKLLPEVELKASGHRGIFVKTFNRKTKNHFFKKWSRHSCFMKGKKKWSLILKRHNKRKGHQITSKKRDKRKRFRKGMSKNCKRCKGAKHHLNS